MDIMPSEEVMGARFRPAYKPMKRDLDFDVDLDEDNDNNSEEPEDHL